MQNRADSLLSFQRIARLRKKQEREVLLAAQAAEIRTTRTRRAAQHAEYVFDDNIATDVRLNCPRR